MLKYSLHNHTYRCKHAQGSEEDMVIHAIENGFEVFGLSDHMPYNTKATQYRMEYHEKDEHLNIIDELKIKYQKEIVLYAGFEAEYQDDLVFELHNLLKTNRIDYLVLGQHYQDIHNPSTYYGYSNNDSHVEAYVDQCIQAMETGLFLFIAHPDLFMNYLDDFTDVCLEQSDRLIQAAIKNNVCLEYNAGGVRSRSFKQNEAYPRLEFWQLVEKYQAPVIVNADAHSPKQIVDEAYQIACKEAIELNLNIQYDIDLDDFYKDIR